MYSSYVIYISPLLALTMIPMSRFFIAVALCVLPAMVSAARPFWLGGIVYCDTCRCGFETTATYNIEGAVVRVECRRDTKDMKLAYKSPNITTDANGKWEVQVNGDQQDELCHAVLVSSPMEGCRTPDPGRRKASVILTRANGVTSDRHSVNSMGFWINEELILPQCDNILAHYHLNSDVWKI